MSKSLRKNLLRTLLPHTVIDEVVYQNPYTFVRVRCHVKVDRYTKEDVFVHGVGFSKSNPNYDKYSEELGFAIAEGRALSDLIDNYMEYKIVGR